MPFKVFQNNTALTAEDLNDFAIEQAVLTFADATARNNAIPSPNTGMHCFLISTGRTYYYSGTKWIELLPGEVSGFSANQVLVCTSTARPGHAIGRLIYETDTAMVWSSNGSAWNFVGGKAPFLQTTFASSFLVAGLADSNLTNFMTATTNPNGMWNQTNTNDKYAFAPTTGWYRLSANLALSGGAAGNGVIARITSGTTAGTAYCNASVPVWGANETHIAPSTTQYLTAGSTVRLILYVTNQMQLNHLSFNAQSRLTIEYLSS